MVGLGAVIPAIRRESTTSGPSALLKAERRRAVAQLRYRSAVSVIAAVVASIVLVGLAVFQVALIAGAPIGRFAWGGQHDVLPTKLRVGSVVSIVLYALFVIVLLDRARVIDVLPDVVSTVGAWVLVGYFALGVVLNGISRSKPERNLFTPVSLVLAVLCLLVALG